MTTTVNLDNLFAERLYYIYYSLDSYVYYTRQFVIISLSSNPNTKFGNIYNNVRGDGGRNRGNGRRGAKFG